MESWHHTVARVKEKCCLGWIRRRNGQGNWCLSSSVRWQWPQNGKERGGYKSEAEGKTEITLGILEVTGRVMEKYRKVKKEEAIFEGRGELGF